MRLLHFVERNSGLEEHWAGINTAVDAQQRHAHAIEIAARQGPEAAMGVAILRTNSRMEGIGAMPRELEYFGLQDELAARDDQVRRQRGDERLGPSIVWIRHPQRRDAVERHWIPRAQSFEFAATPR